MKKLKLIASYVPLTTCLVFIPTKKYIKYFNSTTRIKSRKSNGMSEESIEKFCRFLFITRHEF